MSTCFVIATGAFHNQANEEDQLMAQAKTINLDELRPLGPVLRAISGPDDPALLEELRLVTNVLDALDALDAFPEYAQFGRDCATWLIPRIYYDLWLIMRVTSGSRQRAIRKFLHSKTPAALKSKRELEKWGTGEWSGTSSLVRAGFGSGIGKSKSGSIRAAMRPTTQVVGGWYRG
jgi:hypothetical protein